MKTRWMCPICEQNIIDLNNALSYVEITVEDKPWSTDLLVCGSTCAEAFGNPFEITVLRAMQHHYEEVAWQRVSLYSGYPIGMPKAHLTTDNERTICGIKIPQIGKETKSYRYEECFTGRKCERCFTEVREEAIRRQM